MIAATLTLESAADRVWDAIVIGAGPAGALAAREAALTRARVLLVEAKSFPRNKVCGACLNGQALAVLESAGLQSLPESLRARPLRHFDVRSRGRRANLRLPIGCAVSRYRFDAALVESAIAAGAEFLPETSASVAGLSESPRDEHRAVSLKRADAPPALARAKVVLVADGLAHASLREHPEFSSRVAPAHRIGLGGQVSDYPAEYSPGTIFMAIGRNGYVGLVRIEDDRLNIAAALAPEFVKQAGSAARALAAVLQEAGFPPILALEQADWHGTIPLTRRPARTAGRRVLLLGDAAGYVEPFTGEGMAWALASGSAAAAFVARSAQTWDGTIEREWETELQRLVLRRQRWCRWLAAGLRHPLAVSSILNLVSLVPALAGPVLRNLNRAPRLEP